MRYGRLTIVKEIEPYTVPSTGRKYPKVLAKCDCGKEKEFRLAHLKRGDIQSCGCIHKEMLVERNTTHNLTKNPLYKRWHNMRSRCFNKDHTDYHSYGGRGITICDEWKESVEPFITWAEVNGYKEGLEIDRIDVNGNYCPENCRFVTRSLNARNIRSKTNSSSQYRGVSWKANRNKWMARVKVKGEENYLGYHLTEEAAAEAVNKFNSLHFPGNPELQQEIKKPLR